MLRQLVELQLCHSQEIKAIIDRAYGVVHNKHKKTETPSLPPPPGDPHSQERLQLIPLGQDKERKRYWIVDGAFWNVSVFIFVFASVCRPCGCWIVSDGRHFAASKIDQCFWEHVTNCLSSRQIPRGSTCLQIRGRSPPRSRPLPQHETNIQPFWRR